MSYWLIRGLAIAMTILAVSGWSMYFTERDKNDKNRYNDDENNGGGGIS
jgi:hypothetical protein